MVLFVALAQPFEDLDRLVLAGRLDDDLLEASRQGVVFFDVLAVLVQRRRTDALDLAASQGRLEHVGRVDGAFRTAGPDQRVQFVDEQDRVLRPAHFVHHRLDAFFELAAVLGAGDHHGQVEHDDPLVGQQLGHVAADDALGKAFDDGRLADAGFAQQHRIVLGAAAEDLDRPFDFALAADHRIELALPGQFGQVATETVQRRRLGLAALGGSPLRRPRRLAATALAASPPSMPWPSRFSTSSRTSSSFRPRFIST